MGTGERPSRSFARASVALFERLMPDALILAIGLTALVAGAAALFAPNGTPFVILTSWYEGLFGILSFAFQMILVLVTGHALAHAPLIERALKAIVTAVRTPERAVSVAFLTTAAASWINWGFGLVVAGVLSREIAKRTRLDFAWLVAAAYSGFVIYASGLSASIPLSQASPGNALNIVEKVTGHIVPFSESIFTAFNLVPTLIVLVLMPAVLLWLRPPPGDVQVYLPPTAEAVAKAVAPPDCPAAFARRLERSRLFSLFLVAAAAGYLVVAARSGRLHPDINLAIFIFLMLGLILHQNALAYADAIKAAAKETGAMMLQYPIYGGIMGIMTATGLAEEISRSVAATASAHTLPLFSFLSSILISMVIPSGGGHWAVQGPFTVPAAMALHASIPATTMAVAMGEEVANMLQPFWALPVVAIAGIRIQRVLGFTIATFAVSTLAYGIALVLLV